MSGATRRQFLGGAVLAGAAAPSLRTQDPEPGARSARPAGDELEQLATRLLEADEAGAAAVAREALRGGTSFRTLLGAVHLAGTREVRPRPVGFQLHAVMMVPSAITLAERSDEPERTLFVLFNVLDLKRSQQLDRRAGDWRLPSPPRADDALDARAEFVRAIDLADEARAQALVPLVHESCSLDDAFELLWPLGARDFHNIGHKIIFVHQSHRMLQDVGWRHGEPVLRSLVHALTSDGDATARDANLRRADTLPDDWREGARDPAASTKLLASSRDAAPEEASAAVAAALRGDCSAASLWDALRLFAFEVFAQHPGILGVHPITVLNAMRLASLRSRVEPTQRLLLLQAADWTARFRVAFANQGAAGEPQIETLGEVAPGAAPNTTDLLAALPRDRVSAARLAARLAADGRLGELGAALIRTLAHKGKEHHDHKFLVAALEEIEAAPAAHRPMLAGAVMLYARGSGEEDGRAVQFLAR